jgi:hyperosmotically inducible periplasmic protein
VEAHTLKLKWIGVAVSAGFLFCAQSSLVAQDKKPPSDNTKVNKEHKTTADQAKENTGDRELMQKIRKAVMDDKSLSTYAHNVKIIAQHGKVTLKGPVRTAEEKATIARLATDIAGAANVDNQITVQPSKKKTE